MENSVKEEKLEYLLKEIVSILEDHIKQNDELLDCGKKLKFERKYTYKFYEIFCDMLLNFRYVYFFNNEELYRKLEIPKSMQYTSKLLESVIKPSLAEINAKTLFLARYKIDKNKKRILFIVDTKKVILTDREILRKIINAIKNSKDKQ